MGLSAIGLFRLRWQQFLAAAATIAVINAVVGGAFIAVTIRGLFAQAALALVTIIGAVAALLLASSFSDINGEPG